MKTKPTKRETQIIDETLPHPKKLHWWQKLGAKIAFICGTLTGRKGGG